MGIYAMIKNGVVINKIVADEDTANALGAEYDSVVLLDAPHNHPNLGDFHGVQGFVKAEEKVADKSWNEMSVWARIKSAMVK
jgi:hypothetical protein